ncbi:MAG: hypothetical protein ACTS42_02005 [Candidatus Hodgkinia cicadicola]
MFARLTTPREANSTVNNSPNVSSPLALGKPLRSIRFRCPTEINIHYSTLKFNFHQPPVDSFVGPNWNSRPNFEVLNILKLPSAEGKLVTPKQASIHKFLRVSNISILLAFMFSLSPGGLTSVSTSAPLQFNGNDYCARRN